MDVRLLSELHAVSHRAIAGVALACLLLGPVTAAGAVQITGSISGFVTGPDGDAVEGATVTVQGDALPARQLTDVTDARGRYRLAPVPAGTYVLTVDAPDFATQRREEFQVRLDQNVVLHWELQLASVTEEVTVTSGAPAMEMGRSTLGSRITPDEIQELPLNGRNFEDLVKLTPGVRPDPGGEVEQEFSIFGERPAATSFVVDGADNNDPVDGGSLQRFTQDSIQEFEVITTGYAAEFGRAQAGVVNVITKSGGNAFQGSAFVFGRNDSLDSSNIEGQEVPDLNRVQWGGSVGGPIVEDELFFFGSTEILDEDRGRNIDRSRVPDWVEDGLATPSGAEDFSLGPNIERRDALFRVDWRLNDSNRLAIINNFTHDDVSNEVPPPVAGSLVLPSGTTATRRNVFNSTVRETWVAGGNLFLETAGRVSLSRTDDNDFLQQRPEPILLLFNSGFIQLGAPFAGRTNRDLLQFQLTQDLSLLEPDLRGIHDIKVGYDFLRSDLTGSNAIVNDVEYSAAFLAPNQTEIMQRDFEQYGFEQAAARFFTLSGNPDGSLDVDITNNDFSTYVQDTWTPEGTNLTLDLGLRYDYASLFGDDTDNVSPRIGGSWDPTGSGRVAIKGAAGLFYDRSALQAAATVPEKGGFFTKNSFDVALPRLGLNYSESLIDLVITSGFPTGGGGRTPAENPAYREFADALRNDPLALYGMLGIAVDDPSNPPVVTADNIQQLSGMTPDQVLSLLEATWPGTDWEWFDVPGGSVVGDRVLSFFPRGPLEVTRQVSRYSEDNTPHTWAYNIGVDVQVTDTMMASASFVVRRTRDLLTRRITNLFDVPPGDPDFGQTVDGGPRINDVTYEGVVDYEGFVVSLRRAFRDRFGFSASYTYSEAKDNLLTGGVGSGFSDNNDPMVDYGPSNLSVPHVFVANGNALLPYGVRFGAATFLRSGSAFSPRGIQDLDGDGLVDQRDVTVPRNSFRTDPFFSLNLRGEKAFAVAPGHELSVLVDVFNLTNRKNVAGVNAVSGDEFGVPNAFFSGREIQIGVRYFLGGR